MSVTRIFDGAHLRADLSYAARPGLIVSYDWRVIGRRGFSDLSPNPAFAQAGYDQLMIATARNDWFINPDTQPLEDVLRALAPRYADVRTIGFSMGGYSALRFSAAIGATRLVAVSPQVSICRDHAPFEWRYREEARDFDPDLGALTGRVAPGLTGHLLVDDLNAADLAHARAIQRLSPGLSLVRLTGGGHPAIGVLKQARRAGRVQKLMLDPAMQLSRLRADHRANRAQLPDYWDRLAAGLNLRHPSCAALSLNRAARLRSLPRRGG